MKSDFFSIRVLIQTLEQIHLKDSKRQLMGSDFRNCTGPFIIIWILLSVVVSFPFVGFAEDASATPPAATLLEAGDLIWPKKPGVIVPYVSTPGEAGKSDAMRWAEEKEDYLNQIRRNPNPSPQEKERYAALQHMTYEEFVDYYLVTAFQGRLLTSAWGSSTSATLVLLRLSTGNRSLWRRCGVLVFSAYLMQIGCRSALVNSFGWDASKTFHLKSELRWRRWAAEQIGKPYNFWDFDLEDASGFYCSKLAWLSILQGAGFPPDDNPNPHRALWYSPKQLIKSKHVELIVKSWSLPFTVKKHFGKMKNTKNRCLRGSFECFRIALILFSMTGAFDDGTAVSS